MLGFFLKPQLLGSAAFIGITACFFWHTHYKFRPNPVSEKRLRMDKCTINTENTKVKTQPTKQKTHKNKTKILAIIFQSNDFWVDVGVAESCFPNPQDRQHFKETLWQSKQKFSLSLTLFSSTRIITFHFQVATRIYTDTIKPLLISKVQSGNFKSK